MCWEPLEALLVVRSHNNKIEDKNDDKEQFYWAKLLVSIISFSRCSQVTFDGGVSQDPQGLQTQCPNFNFIYLFIIYSVLIFC